MADMVGTRLAPACLPEHSASGTWCAGFCCPDSVSHFHTHTHAHTHTLGRYTASGEKLNPLSDTAIKIHHLPDRAPTHIPKHMVALDFKCRRILTLSQTSVIKIKPLAGKSSTHAHTHSMALYI